MSSPRRSRGYEPATGERPSVMARPPRRESYPAIGYLVKSAPPAAVDFTQSWPSWTLAVWTVNDPARALQINGGEK